MKYCAILSSPMTRFILLCGSILSSANCLAAITYSAWPNTTAVTTADGSNQFGGNLSGLYYEPAAGSQAASLWAVQNSPSKIYKMVWNAASNTFIKSTSSGWSNGKTLRYPNGSGAPDAEGITKAELSGTDIYVSTERDGSGSNRFSVLRYDLSGTATTLNATHEWNLTLDLPNVSSTNLGLEAITWIPDRYLVANGFIDERFSLPYDPNNYPTHGTGLFFVGLEANGQIYAYALNSDGSFARIATINSGHSKIMDLSFDWSAGALWAYCDNGCNNRSHLLDIDNTPGALTEGKFIIRKAYERPSSMSNINNEGIAIAPASECINNVKSFFWADDSETSGHAIRRGKIPCGPLF